MKYSFNATLRLKQGFHCARTPGPREFSEQRRLDTGWAANQGDVFHTGTT